MRTIKFRAWNIENKKMTTLDVERVGHYYEAYSAQPKDIVLMQYTGLKDKNGKEIYESDLVRLGSEELTVEWVENGWWIRNIERGLDQRLSSNDALDCVVIGNIYQDKEILND